MSFRHSAKTLLRGRRGATALEFAILAIPFWMMLLGLMELGLDFYVQLALDYAVQEGARKLQTGAGNAAASAAVFKTDCLCPLVASFLNCNQISLDVYPVTTADYYLNARAGGGAIPLSNGTLSTSAWSFSPSGAATPMFMQAIYTSVAVVAGFIPGFAVQSAAGQVHVTSSAIGFINEPFSSSSAVCGISS
jgi:hypothetical protein